MFKLWACSTQPIVWAALLLRSLYLREHQGSDVRSGALELEDAQPRQLRQAAQLRRHLLSRRSTRRDRIPSQILGDVVWVGLAPQQPALCS